MKSENADKGIKEAKSASDKAVNAAKAKATLNNYDRVLVGVSYCILKNLKLQANYGYSIYTSAAKVASNNNHRGSSQVQLMAMYKF